MAERRYTPSHAFSADCRPNDRLGLQRVVIVQPGVYGTDNGCLLEALAFFAERARRVVMVDDATNDAALQTLHDAGVRVNHESGARGDAASLAATLIHLGKRLRGMPCHL